MLALRAAMGTSLSEPCKSDFKVPGYVYAGALWRHLVQVADANGKAVKKVSQLLGWLQAQKKVNDTSSRRLVELARQD